MCIENFQCHISVKFVHFKTQILPLNSAFYAADTVECFSLSKVGYLCHWVSWLSAHMCSTLCLLVFAVEQ